MDAAQEFLNTSHLYHLGELLTEKPHPKTIQLSKWSQNNLPKAIEVLKDVDLEALKTVETTLDKIFELKQAVDETRQQGGRIFLCGCGATGRLSLTIETLWRKQNPGDESVVGFMAGGDVALVHSLEGFEDYPEYGARHLQELGFAENDLLISSTEGGETPYVIGATEKACSLSKRKPYFLYCNPDDLLCEKVERSKTVIENPQIKKINLTVGPMALAGSTRMQASTVLELAVGLAVLESGDKQVIQKELSSFVNYVNNLDFSFLEKFIECESDIYLKGEHLTYKVDGHGITVFTDTTERSPTFSLMPFEHAKSERKPSLCYIMLPGAEDEVTAWQMLLNRKPRVLNWPDVSWMTTEDYLMGFDFSQSVKERREKAWPGSKQHFFNIEIKENKLLWELDSVNHAIEFPEAWPDLYKHITLKLLLNIHSTLIMGRQGRYQNNLMTWVFPTNGKLVDRAARYTLYLLEEQSISNVSYEEVVKKIFSAYENLNENESVVVKVLSSFLDR